MARFQLPLAFLAAGTALLLPNLAHAHFVLKAPANWMTQDDSGNPQKTGPCGGAMEGGKTYTPSNVVTPFKAGETIAITIDETITHPGHYRVALALTDRADLPDEPVITGNNCGSAAIMDPPVFPVLADGQLKHTSAFNGDQTIMVKLPDDISCEKCTLQVIEFMSAHAAPCFYHHCADISITNDGSAGMSSGGQSSGGAPNAGIGGQGGAPSQGGAAGTPASSGGMGGVMGQAGTSGAGASSAGAGGLTNGGTAGTTTGSAGTPSALGGTGGAGTAGTPSGIAGTPAVPPVSPATASEQESGCSISPQRSSSGAALLGLLGLAAIRARRRRRS